MKYLFFLLFLFTANLVCAQTNWETHYKYDTTYLNASNIFISDTVRTWMIVNSTIITSGEISFDPFSPKKFTHIVKGDTINYIVTGRRFNEDFKLEEFFTFCEECPFEKYYSVSYVPDSFFMIYKINPENKKIFYKLGFRTYLK